MHVCRSLRSLALAALAAFALGLAPAPSWGEEELGNEAGIGAGAALASLVYAPVKLIYAACGGVTAGLAWLFSAGDADVVNPIVDASLRGDYVVTPSHLREQRWPEFIGRSPAQRSAHEDATAASTPAEETF